MLWFNFVPELISILLFPMIIYDKLSQTRIDIKQLFLEPKWALSQWPMRSKARNGLLTQRP